MASALKNARKTKAEGEDPPRRRGSLTAASPSETREQAFLQTLAENGRSWQERVGAQRSKPGQPSRNAATEMPQRHAGHRGPDPEGHTPPPSHHPWEHLLLTDIVFVRTEILSQVGLLH